MTRFCVVSLCLTLVTSIASTAVVLTRSAAADQISDLKGQAAQVAQQLIKDQLQVDGYEQQYALAMQRQERDALAVSQTEQQIVEDARRVNQDRALLRGQALSEYTSSSPASLGGMQLFEGDQKTAAIKADYEQIASANVIDTIDQLRGAQSALRSAEATLQQRETLDETTSSQAAVLLQQARNGQAQLQALQAKVTGELAAAVAQQQAIQAAAAAAAVRAAEASAAKRKPASNSGPGSQVVSDPLLPPFLQCVKQAESGGNYNAVSPGGTYMGAFQFSQATWDMAAALAGLPGLVGVPPNQATPAQQDAVALALYTADGEQPWYDSCRSA
jgi:Transglycosylase-like domain